ncbi:hypothetical protein BGX34_000202 [Mortierella sp. NVP85]|nr:hypothetical protein BGX34_000202 [Mortierella sp. NVP85]
MAQCYSSGTPLNALANQLLGESSLSAKPSLFRPPQQNQLQTQLQTHQAPFPRQTLPRQNPSLHRPRLPDPKHVDFEQAWSTSARVPNPTTSISHPYHPHSRLPEPFQLPQDPLFEQTDLPHLNLIAAWEKVNDDPSHLLQTTLSGTSMLPAPSLLTSEFESFHYKPEVHDFNNVSQDGDWNKEWATHKTNDDDDDDDDDDEFREEWSNDHFTQAYINTHRSKFQEIEEQERLKEARLEEERERLRQASGGPPRSAWMMAGASSAAATATESIVTDTTMQTGPRRLRVPGLDTRMEHPQASSPTITFHVDEFMNFTHQDPMSLQPPQQSLPQKPIHTQDQFMFLVSDLHIAEQIYFPGATSAITPEALESDRPLSPLRQHAAPSSLSSSSTENHNSWAYEFVAEDRHQRQKHAGAEWNWEKLFGKDPRRQMELATEASKAAAAAVAKATGKSSAGEAERLKAVALTRLQALFGHLTVTPSQSAHSPASAHAP